MVDVDHDEETYSLTNVSTLNFSVQGFGAAVHGYLHGTNEVLRSHSVDASGTGMVPAMSSGPVILHGTVTVLSGTIQ